jgi:hypothetical protein
MPTLRRGQEGLRRINDGREHGDCPGGPSRDRTDGAVARRIAAADAWPEVAGAFALDRSRACYPAGAEMGTIMARPSW